MKTKYMTVGLLIASMTMASHGCAQEHGHGKQEHGQEATGHSHEMAQAHGGIVTMTKEFHLEVVFHRNMVVVHAYDNKQVPMDPRHVEGLVRVDFRDKKRKRVSASLHYVAPAQHRRSGKSGESGQGHGKEGHGKIKQSGGTHDAGDIGHLMAKIDLAKVSEADAKVTISLKKLPGNAEKELMFKETFRLTRLTEYVCPMKHTKPVAQKGKCPKCGMALKPVNYIYACPMHPKITARKAASKCWKCKMNLVKSTEAVMHAEEGKKKHAEGSGHKHK